MDETVTVVGHEPIFTVVDVARAVEHYRGLGFDIEFYDGGYAFASLDGRLTIHLTTHESGERMPSQLYLHVDDADRLVERWRAAGHEIADAQDVDWGKHESRHTDPDGNVIRFGSPARGPAR